MAAMARWGKISTGLTIVVALGLIALVEPFTQIFQRRVQLNNLFMGVLALVTLVALAGLVLSFRGRQDQPPSSSAVPNVVRAVGIVEVVFLIVVWTTIGVTGAYDSDGIPARGKATLELKP